MQDPSQCLYFRASVTGIWLPCAIIYICLFAYGEHSDNRGGYRMTERLGITKGRYQGNARGFGFVLDDGGSDIYIGPEDGKGAMDGDIVLAKSKGSAPDGRRREGVVIRVVERVHARVVGRFTELAN